MGSVPSRPIHLGTTSGAAPECDGHVRSRTGRRLPRRIERHRGFSSWACLRCSRPPALHDAGRDIVGSRQAMSRSVTHRGSGSPTPRSGGQLVGRGPTNLGYETAEAVGFELVPERVAPIPALERGDRDRAPER